MPGRSHLDAVLRHKDAQWIYSLDLENFFPSVPHSRVRHVMEQLGYSSQAASLVADLSCFRGGLAQGSPASPVLANLVLLDLDERLFSLSNVYGIKYSRYADDLVFSSLVSDCPVNFREDVKRLVTGDGWRLAQSKEYFAERPRRLKVHGLLVDRLVPRLTKGYRNRLRAYQHLLARGGLNEDDQLMMRGHIAYADSVRRKIEAG